MWQNSFSVGIKLIDEQHNELINLTNKLFASCMGGHEKSKTIFIATIREVTDYVDYHFCIEEIIMETMYYPRCTEHKKEHADFKREVFNMAEDVYEGKIHAPLSIVCYLRNWVLQHVAECGDKMGVHIQSLQRSGEFLRILHKVKQDCAVNWTEQ